MRVNKLLASSRRMVSSLAVHVAHADNGVEAAASSAGMPSPTTACSSPAPWAASVPVLPRAPLVTFT
jgi:hypothetical protein